MEHSWWTESKAVNLEEGERVKRTDRERFGWEQEIPNATTHCWVCKQTKLLTETVLVTFYPWFDTYICKEHFKGDEALALNKLCVKKEKNFKGY
jgi:hypothetical protein